jgi:hypothetical protein
MLRTRVDALNLLVPQDREGNFSKSLFARYQRSEKALLLSLMEIYIKLSPLVGNQNHRNALRHVFSSSRPIYLSRSFLPGIDRGQSGSASPMIHCSPDSCPMNMNMVDTCPQPDLRVRPRSG